MEKKKQKKGEQIKLKIVSILCIILMMICIVSITYCYMMNQKNTSNPYEINVAANDNFVFVGDSITERYPLEEFYDDLPIINSGISGYTTDDILENIDEKVSVYNPTKVFLLIGTNDIRNGKSNPEIIQNISEIVKRIEKKRPNAKIYIESIYPINNTDSYLIDHEKIGIRTNEIIQDLNKEIKHLCFENNYTYIDMYKELIDEEGNLAIKYTIEGLHISNLGYLKITKVLYPYLQQ